MNEQELKQVIEALLFAADEPLNLNRLMSLFPEDNHPGKDAIQTAISQLQDDYREHSLELREIGSGFRFQVRQDYAEWVSRLWEEKPARYSRATLETLALIAYRQPITRAEIEEVRGVAVSSNIIKSLMERDWIKVVGHRDVPGKPSLYATTKGFLDYFNLSSLENLPTLAELRDIDAINAELDFDLPEGEQAATEDTVTEESAETDQQHEATTEVEQENEDAQHEEHQPQTDTDDRVDASVDQNDEVISGEQDADTGNEELEEILSAEN